MKTKNTMLRYSMIILEKVSFDKRLFWKEYRKLKRSLSGNEPEELRNWVKEMYPAGAKTLV